MLTAMDSLGNKCVLDVLRDARDDDNPAVGFYRWSRRVEHTLVNRRAASGDTNGFSNAESMTQTASVANPNLVKAEAILSASTTALSADGDLATRLDGASLESVVEFKISRFLDQLGGYYPDNLHELIMRKVEKPLIGQILRRMGGNQVAASRLLGINRNTLRKKMKMFGF